MEFRDLEVKLINGLMPFEDLYLTYSFNKYTVIILKTLILYFISLTMSFQRQF